MTVTEDGQKTVDDYYDKSLDRFAEWIKHQDSKAAFVLVILGIASADLLDHATRLADAHKLASGWGGFATVAFWFAVAAGTAVVVLAWLTVMPRLTPPDRSVYFFRTVASYRTVADYRKAVEGQSEDDRRQDLAEQVWELARHVATKAKYARYSYVAVFVFLLAWGASRVALSVAV